MSYTIKREYDTVNPLSEMKHLGVWVVRDERGSWVDADKYRHNLYAKFGKENLKHV